MDINREAPVQGVAEIDVAAPVELVWRVQAEVTSWPRWNPDVKSVELNEPMSVGAHFKWNAGGMNIISRLVAVDPPRQLGWTGRAFGLRARHVWRLVPSEAGTRVRTEESLEGPGASILRIPLRVTLRSALARSVRSLKEESERRAELGTG